MDTTTPRQVGKSRLAVPPLGFGGGTIGNPRIDNETSLATVAGAWNTGVRLFDTAPFYGLGRSERRLGLGLAGLADRNEFQVNTKIGRSLVPEPVRDEANKTLSPGGEVRTPRDPVSGFRVHFEYTEAAILGQHADSLQRLGLSSVDSLTIHDIDYGHHSPDAVETHLAELAPDGGGGATALEDLRGAGLISAIGCGCNLEARNAWSWDGGKHEELCARIADLVDLDFFVVAGGYTLLETRALRRILPLCEERRIGVVIAAPYAGGWLADPSGSSAYMYAPAPPAIVARSRRMQAICRDHDVTLAAAALQFPLAHPAVAAVIPGAKSPEEPVANRRNLDTEIPRELWRRFQEEGLLDEMAPTP